MITEMIRALNAGQQLKNSEGWKNAQVTTANIITIMGAVLAGLSLVGVHIQASQDQIALIAGGIAGVLGVFNAYATVATTKTIGLRPRAGNTDDPGNADPTLMG